MRKCFYFFIAVSISLLIINCKENNNIKESKPLTISFKKEGTLLLKKANGDSIIKTLDIEIADDEYQIQTGLMYRDTMKDNQGMLFLFPDEAPRSFLHEEYKNPFRYYLYFCR